MVPGKGVLDSTNPGRQPAPQKQEGVKLCCAEVDSEQHWRSVNKGGEWEHHAGGIGGLSWAHLLGKKRMERLKRSLRKKNHLNLEMVTAQYFKPWELGGAREALTFKRKLCKVMMWGWEGLREECRAQFQMQETHRRGNFTCNFSQLAFPKTLTCTTVIRCFDFYKAVCVGCW